MVPLQQLPLPKLTWISPTCISLQITHPPSQPLTARNPWQASPTQCPSVTQSPVSSHLVKESKSHFYGAPVGLHKKLAIHILPVIYPPLVKGFFYQVNYGKLPGHVFVTCPAKTGEELTEKPKKYS